MSLTKLSLDGKTANLFLQCSECVQYMRDGIGIQEGEGGGQFPIQEYGIHMGHHNCPSRGGHTPLISTLEHIYIFAKRADYLVQFIHSAYILSL
jgi:hypothetical protein